MIKELENEVEIQDLIHQKNNLILDFYAEWCPPCRQLSPVIEYVSRMEKYEKIIFLKINISQFSNIAKEAGISSIPTLIFISSSPDKERERYLGFINQDRLVSLIEQFFFT